MNFPLTDRTTLKRLPAGCFRSEVVFAILDRRFYCMLFCCDGKPIVFPPAYARVRRLDSWFGGESMATLKTGLTLRNG